jgi:YfiH family protein
MLREKSKDNLVYFQFDKFANYEHIFDHFFSSRIGWDRDKEKMKEQISWLLNLPKKNIIDVKQVHGTEIIVVNSYDMIYDKDVLEADGLVTDLPGIALITYHADCVPVYFVDITKKVVALAHSGWKGTFNNITGKMIKTMIEHYNSKKEDILIGIGPSIGPCCYEVKDDLIQMFTKRYPNYKDIIRINGDRTLLDLWRVNYLQIIDEGIPKENIIQSNVCTSCNTDKFYSYRKEKGIDKRMVAVISLK